MVRNLKIATKLVGAIGIVAVAAAIAIGWFVIRRAEATLRNQAIALLDAERQSRARLVAAYFERVHHDALVSAKLLVTQIALREMPAALRAGRGESSEYARLHALVDSIARGWMKESRYQNVYLVGADGTILYSAANAEIASDVKTVSSTSLAEAWSRAITASADSTHFVDFAPAQSGGGDPFAFVSTPVLDSESQALLGVLAYQMSPGEINAIMTDSTGFGDAAQTFLLGPDSTTRTATRQAPMLARIDTEAARRGLAGEAATIEQDDAGGVRVLSSFGPVRLAGARWVLVSEVNLDAALAPARQFRSQLALLLTIVGLVSALMLWIAMRRIVLSPVAALTAGARRIAEHNYHAPVRLSSKDELGMLGESFNGMMASVAAHVDALQRAQNVAERGQRLLDVAPDAIVIADITGRIVAVNQATERLFGYAREELVGQPIELLVPEAAAGAHVALRERYLATPATRSMGSGRELSGRRKDGSLVLVDISLSPLEDAEGRLIVAAVRDITERRQAQKQLQESEERLEAAARGANLGLWDVEPQSNRVLTNRIFESQLGYPPGGLRETDEQWALLRGGLAGWVELLHPDDREAVAAKIQQYLDGALDIYKAEHRVRAPDGSYRWILSVGNSITRDDAGRPLRVNGVHIDISEMKALQLDLQLRYEELQRLQTLRDGLVHMIVHDLRSPLTSVMGFIDLLRTNTAATAEERRQFINVAYTAATQMVELISSLLDINRLEAGEMPVDRQVVDLCAVADEAVQGVSGLAIDRELVRAAP
ncbi:MAG TPA: PAS domain S-box protein, partial [Vicinamibacterales bacterium]|nr:PAS domain S-box protein [Vicinamibacterales bacterium]